MHWPMPRNCPRSPMKHRRAGASSCWPRSGTVCARGRSMELGASIIPFTAQTRMSGVNLNGRESAKGQPMPIECYVEYQGGTFSIPW